MATFDSFLPDVLPYLAADPGEPVVLHAIKRTATRFCTESWVWKHLPAAMNVTAGQALYTPAAPDGAAVARILTAEYDGTPLDPDEVTQLALTMPRWRTDTGTPRRFAQLTPESITLVPVPSSSLAGSLTLTLALRPADDADDLPDWLASAYVDEIVSGVLSRLMLMPGKPWTDLANGQDRREQFRSAIASARADAVDGLGGGVLRTTTDY